MNQPGVAILHFAAPPVVGGVEAVIQAHAWQFSRAGYPLTLIAGRGEAEPLPPDTRLILVPELDPLHPDIAKLNSDLWKGQLPSGFEEMVEKIQDRLAPVLEPIENVIVHNVFTKRFNLAFTAALFRMLEWNIIQHCIAWSHDIDWMSENSRTFLHSGYPWELLREFRSDIQYVAVSAQRQAQMTELFGRPKENIRVIYNGVDPDALLGLSSQGSTLIQKLDLFNSDIILLMPVRITRAKNFEFSFRVIAALKNMVQNPRLVITGPPDPHDLKLIEYYQGLRDLRKEMHLEREIHFVYELGPDPAQPLLVDLRVVGDFYRVSDVLLMPSHREGFGMPILEAGLAGIFVASANIPAAVELGGGDLIMISQDAEPAQIAEAILEKVNSSSSHRLRRKIRQDYTWQALFNREIRSLLTHEQT